MQAANRHEDAAALYSKLLSSSSHQSGHVKELSAFLMDCCCEAYSAVADWEGLQQWLQDFKVPALTNFQISNSVPVLGQVEQSITPQNAAFKLLGRHRVLTLALWICSGYITPLWCHNGN